MDLASQHVDLIDWKVRAESSNNFKQTHTMPANQSAFEGSNAQLVLSLSPTPVCRIPCLLPATRRSATTTPSSPTRPWEIQFFWAPTCRLAKAGTCYLLGGIRYNHLLLWYRNEALWQKKRNIGLNLLFVPNAEHARPKHTKCCMFWLLASCEVSTNSCVWSWGSGNHELWISTGVNLFAAVSSTTWQYISLGICMDCSYILVSFVALQTPWQHHTASKALSSHSAIVLTTPPPQPSVQRRPKTYSIRMSEPRCPLLILGQTLGPSILIYFDTFGAFWSCVCPSFTVIKWKFGGPPPKKGPKHCWRPPASPSSRSIPRGPHAGSRTQLKEWVKIEGAKRWCFFLTWGKFGCFLVDETLTPMRFYLTIWWIALRPKARMEVGDSHQLATCGRVTFWNQWILSQTPSRWWQAGFPRIHRCYSAIGSWILKALVKHTDPQLPFSNQQNPPFSSMIFPATNLH